MRTVAKFEIRSVVWTVTGYGSGHKVGWTGSVISGLMLIKSSRMKVGPQPESMQAWGGTGEGEG